jgi:hypothetical protein
LPGVVVNGKDMRNETYFLHNVEVQRFLMMAI